MKKVWSARKLREKEKQGYRIIEQVSTKGRVYVNVLTPTGQPRTVELATKRSEVAA